jgi:ABC-type multidrug transport system fused ATPase/permease subunit
MWRWWILIVIGCLLLWSLLNITAGLVAFLLTLLFLWFAQMERINFLALKIQEGVQKLEKILPKWFPQN